MNQTPDPAGRPAPEPIAIIGMSCLFPKADNLQSFWANIKNGVDAITEVPTASHWNPRDFFNADPKAPDQTYCLRGGFISPVQFDPLEFGIAPKDLEATDTTQLLGLVAAKQALLDAGYGGDREFNRDRTSVILGVTGTLELVIPLGARLGHPIWRRALQEAGVDAQTSDDVVQRIADSYVGWQENSFPGLLGNVTAGRISNRLNLGGTNCVVDAACASSLSAIHLATLELQAGRSDMVISGGLDTFNDIFMYMCFSKTPALSPTGDAKPFDRDGDGTILGEGIGTVVLKRLSDAQRDGDRIYAVIRGLGSSSDGKGAAVYAPVASGQMKALRRTYEQGGVTPDSIEMVEAHGTGTRVGDATEVTALTSVYRDAKAEGTWCALGSVKSQIGHTKAAAGAAGLIKAALALHHKVLPPTIKVRQPVEPAAPGKSPFYLNTTKRPWLPSATHPRRAALSAFGFGGSNFHCLLEEVSPTKSAPDWDGDTEVVALSADTVAELKQALNEPLAELSWPALQRRAAKTRAAFSRNSATAGASAVAQVSKPAVSPTSKSASRAPTRTHQTIPAAAGLETCDTAGLEACGTHAKPFRLLLVIERGRTDLKKLVTAARAQLEKHSTKSWQLPEGAFFGCGRPNGRLGVLFPGQGSQYSGMLRDLSCQFPQMQAGLAQANEIFAEAHLGEGRARLTDYIYPHPAFDEATAKAQDATLKATDIAQPAIGAVSLAALQVLESFGVSPEAAAGHSYGELLALCASERIHSDTLHRLSNLRGRLMAQANGAGESGAMLAVKAPVETVEQFIREERFDLVVANRNAPDQAVLAGAVGEIERASQSLERRAIWNRRLPVAAAFHSPLVAAAQAPFAAALSTVELSQSRIPVYANTTAREYPREAQDARQLLAGQLANPVDFVAEINAMFADGVTTFLEVGPGHTLTGLVQSILRDRDIHAIALDSSRGKRPGIVDLALALSRLAALGHAVDLTSWNAGVALPEPETGGKPRLTVPLSGANHRTPKPSRPPTPPRALAASPAAAAAPAPVARAIATPSSSAAPLPAPVAKPAASPVAAAPIAAAPGQISEAVRASRESLAVLLQLQEQTARLHRQFLDGQDAARRTMHALLEQQQRLLSGAGPTFSPLPAAATPVAPSVPVAPVARLTSPTIPTPAIAPAPAAAPTRTPAAPTPARADDGRIEKTLLGVVAEKTGYPAEMLNLEMSLDADLGIDSIKRVEILSALQEKLPDAPVIKPDQLGALQTLRQVADFLRQGTATAAPTAVAAVAPAPAVVPAARADTSRVEQTLLGVVAEKTGYPAEMLNLGMSLDADLGIDSIKRVEILSALQEKLPDVPVIKPDQLGALQSLQQVVDFLCAGLPATAPAAIGSPASSPATFPSARIDKSRIEQTLLGVVAEKTGYPSEMLNLEMSLDADLGIDSIKRVEILSALQEKLPDAPVIKPDQLGALQTLRQVVDFLGAASATAPAAAGMTAVLTNPSAAPAVDSAQVATVLLGVVAEKTGYPAEMLNLEMSLDADLGIDSIKRVEILSALQERLPSAPVIKPDQLGALQTLRQVVEFLSAAAAPKTAARSVAHVAEVPAIPVSAPVQQRLQRLIPTPVALGSRVSAPALTLAKNAPVWVTEDGSSLSAAVAAAFTRKGMTARVVSLAEAAARSGATAELLGGLVVLSPALECGEAFLKQAFLAVQARAAALRRAGKEQAAFLVTVSRLDGRFGFGGNLNQPLSGGLAGLAKTAGREWSEVAAKAIDLAAEVEVAAAADAIVEEALRVGPAEVGVSREGRIGLELIDTPVTQAYAGAAVLHAGDVVVVTGGSRGVTAEVAVGLAQAFQPTLVLLGRSPAPETEPEWLAALHDEAEIKKAIHAHLNVPATPKAVEAQFRRWLANREILRNIARMTAAGATVLYRSVDVRDARQIGALLNELRHEFGPIRGLIHGAGVLADKRIEDKTAEQFDSVWSTKVSGAEMLLAALTNDELHCLVMFSSSTARFGRVGQVDYAMANEVLNKLAQAEARRRPDCRVVAMNWGPWNGGMVTPALRRVFAQEGVGVIEPAAGAELLVRELSAPVTSSSPVEVVVLAPLDGQAAVIPATAGPSSVPVVIARAEAPVAEAAAVTMAFERELSVGQMPCLKSHVLDGRAVFPVALIVEWLAHGALHCHPGLAFCGFDDLRVFKGVRLDPRHAVTLRVLAHAPQRAGAETQVVMELVGGEREKPMLHARARIILGERSAAPPAQSAALQMGGDTWVGGGWYGPDALFHGPEFQGIAAVEACGPHGIAARAKTSPSPKSWVVNPLRGSWIADPLALDVSFQMMILWTLGEQRAPSLPCAAVRYRQFAARFPREGVRVVARVTQATPQKATADIEFLDASGGVLARMEGYECVIDPSLSGAFRRNALGDAA
ncbi:hypothetical protein LBMAG56_00980 [Verrucomicrobiota bacterium]|nr:hypothetical protein LBMAG56_00980 [Verrucomicrobiota bacterium]